MMTITRASASFLVAMAWYSLADTHFLPHVPTQNVAE